MTINISDWAAMVYHSGTRSALPIMTHPGIDLIGESVLDAVTNGKVHYKAIKALNAKYPAAVAATVIMDLTVEAEAFGSKINFAEYEVPTVAHRLVKNSEEIATLSVPGLDKGRIQQYLLAARLAAENITDKPVFGGCIGPVSLAGRLYDMTEIMTAMYLEPEAIHVLLEKCTTFILQYVKAFKEYGVGGIIIAEPAAGLLSSEMCDEFSSAYVKRIVSALQDETFLIILHNCGNTGHTTKSMLSTGARGLHFGNKIDMVQVLNEVPSDVLVLGNLDPVGVFKMSTPFVVEESTRKLLNDTKGFKNFVISSGCDTPPNVPMANIEAFYSAVEKFNRY